jgi:hypothetical protein
VKRQEEDDRGWANKGEAKRIHRKGVLLSQRGDEVGDVAMSRYGF